MACDMAEPCKFPSLDTCQERFLWTHKKVISAPHTVVGLVLLVGDAENCPQAHGFETLDPFSESASRVHVSQPQKMMEVTRDLYKLNLIAKLIVVLFRFLFNLAIAAIVEAILMRISAEQVPFLHGVAPWYLKLVTFSSFWLFMLTSALMLFMLLVMTLLFSMLTSISYAVTLSTSLLVKF